MEIIARIHNDFTDKFGIPRQSGLSDVVSKIHFEPKYRNIDALRGIEQFSHLWLIWNFSENNQKDWSPTVRPPRLGGNKKMGVFATRSPFRPNPIGLTVVKLLKIENTKQGPVIYISGADIMNNTPIYDIKPYIPYCDCVTDATDGFTSVTKDYKLEVVIPDNISENFPGDKLSTLIQILSGDPRPSYHNSDSRVYGLSFGEYNIKFTVDESTLTVREIKKIPVD
ncbi:MAG: tRNA (N6-threonylcarbamoyladenosine(37)-N6)-methyltransferase TrmO [Acutalibacteraceae bacterium]|nr:tRNA (N6-threonylcarbamoyladenosine(37)-N6)-methyltransferase TrmO [Acutalibacteraceae bacterium]